MYFSPLAPVASCGNVKVESLPDAKEITSLQMPVDQHAIIPPSPVMSTSSNSTTARKSTSRGIKRNRSR